MLPRSTNGWLHSKGFTLVLLTACLCTTVRVLRAAEPKASPPIKPSTVRARLAEMQLQATMNELVKVRVELRRARADIEAMRARLRQERQNDIPIAEIEAWVTKDPEVQLSRARIAALVDALTVYERSAAGGKESRFFQDTSRDLDRERNTLTARERKLKPIAEEEIRESRGRKPTAEIAARVAERVTPLETLEQELFTDVQKLAKELESSRPSSDETAQSAIRQIRDLQERIRQITKETDDILRKLEEGTRTK